MLLREPSAAFAPRASGNEASNFVGRLAQNLKIAKVAGNNSDSAHLPVFSSTSMPSEADCSIISAATAGPTGNSPFRAALFTGARLGLARLAAAASLPCAAAEFPLRQFRAL